MKPGIDTVLDSFLAIFPPAVPIIQNVIRTPRLEGEARSTHFSGTPPSLPSILAAAAALFFIGHDSARGAFVQPGLAGEKAGPVDISLRRERG